MLEYLESDDNTYLTKDGCKCSIDRSEIEFLSERCTEVEKMRLRLPIFISTDTSYSEGAWKVEGRTEVAVVSRLLNKKIHTEDFLRLYYPDLKDLRSIVSSVIVVLFIP